MPGAECCRRRLGVSRQSGDCAGRLPGPPFARLSRSVCVQPPNDPVARAVAAVAD